MKKAKVAVIGLTGQSAFLGTEHFPEPGETVACTDLFFEPGGKGHNQAVACARMGVETVFIGAVGDDVNGQICENALNHEGVRTHLIKSGKPTAFAVITTDKEGENTVEVFTGAAKELMPDDLYKDAIREELKDCSYILIQNEVSRDCLMAVVDLAEKADVPVIFNPAPATNVPLKVISRCHLITPNAGEAKTLLKIEEGNESCIAELYEAFRKIGVSRAVITRGVKGACILCEEGDEEIPAFSCGTAIDTTGAGDVFNGTLAASLALGKGLKEAVQMAAIAAGISVTRHGALGSVPRKEEVMRYWNVGKVLEK